eukprot:TRINITY_DN33977_c0_g1_i1.p1 TRINITY_DN33977_c0_g1~~TRINITY_DN33977_c0_g1_i1.p1  ORF type:complete len:756 (+),score=94.55 TRINITY_DN33977_c0_g1_i1:52-2319(+)
MSTAAAACFAALLCFSSTADGKVIQGNQGITLNVTNGGVYSVSVDGKVWLETPAGGGNPMGWDKQLTMNDIQFSTGSLPNLGEYQSAEVTWNAASWKVITTFYVLQEKPGILFRQAYPDGATADTPTGSPNSLDYVVSGFPEFQVGGGEVPLNYLTWNGNQLFESNISRWTKGVFYGGVQGGSPLCFYNESASAMTLGPYDHFMTSIHSNRQNGQVFTAGTLSTIRKIPQNFTHDTLLLIGNGVKESMALYGEALLKRTGKPRLNAYSDFILSHLGFWTDHGSFYYGTHEGYQNMEDAILGVKSVAKANNIPIQYFQWDDWWFWQGGGDTGGMIQWEPKPEVFPSGFTNWTGTPLSLYVDEYNVNTIYRHAPYNYSFLVSATNSLPVDKQFYDDLFANGTKIGMKMFEQDFLSSILLTDLITSNVEDGEAWLNLMGQAAETADVSLQYCMMYPMHALKSTEVNKVTNGRASRDAVGAPHLHLVLGMSSILLDSVGIFSSADNVWTNTTEGTQPKRADPHYETVISMLIGGPYGFSDQAGAADASLISTTCRSDGILLRPDRSATTMDIAFKVGFSSVAAPNIWSTYSEAAGYRWVYILGLNLKDGIEITPLDLSYDSEQSWVVYDYWKGPQSGLSVVTAEKNFTFPACPEPSNPPLPTLGSAYFIAAPVLSNNWVYLGERKVAAASSRRVHGLVSTASDLSVVLLAAPSEAITASVRTPTGTVVSKSCTALRETCPGADCAVTFHFDVNGQATCS